MTDAPDSIKIETKCASDIINCFGKWKLRFSKEVARGFDVLILECSKDDIPKTLKRFKLRMSPQYIFSCLKKLHEDHGVSIIFAGSTDEASQIIHDLLVVDNFLKNESQVIV